jgi:hypothetical protein
LDSNYSSYQGEYRAGYRVLSTLIQSAGCHSQTLISLDRKTTSLSTRFSPHVYTIPKALLHEINLFSTVNSPYGSVMDHDRLFPEYAIRWGWDSEGYDYSAIGSWKSEIGWMFHVKHFALLFDSLLWFFVLS